MSQSVQPSSKAEPDQNRSCTQSQPPSAQETEQSVAVSGEKSVVLQKPDFGEESYIGYGRLKGKVALITGGNSGIGRAIAIAYAKEGCSAIYIVCLQSESEDAKETNRILTKIGAACHVLVADLSRDDDCKRVISEVITCSKMIDILVNNAAYPSQASEDVSRYTFCVNIFGPLQLCRYAVPYMLAGSAIINVSSIQVHDADGANLDYACTKGALASFTQSLAHDPTVVERGIRVNGVALGPIWTSLVQGFHMKHICVGKHCSQTCVGHPVEVSSMFVFLADNKSSAFVVGETIGVTGGHLLK